MLSDPTLYIVLVIVLDVFIVGILVFFLYRNERLRGRISGCDLQSLQQLEASLKLAMDESRRSSEHLLQEFDHKLKNVQEVFARIDDKEADLLGILDRAESATERLQVKQPADRRGAEDAYKEAARLLSEGCTAEQVHKTCGLSYAEIDLIAHIVKSTAA